MAGKGLQPHINLLGHSSLKLDSRFGLTAHGVQMLARACRQDADGVHGIITQNHRLVDAGDALSQSSVTFGRILELVRDLQHPQFGRSWYELFTV